MSGAHRHAFAELGAGSVSVEANGARSPAVALCLVCQLCPTADEAEEAFFYAWIEHSRSVFLCLSRALPIFLSSCHRADHLSSGGSRAKRRGQCRATTARRSGWTALIWSKPSISARS